MNQYYKLPNGSIYVVNKSTGAVSQASSIPSGASVISWGSTSILPPELQGKVNISTTPPLNFAPTAPSIAYGDVNSGNAGNTQLSQPITQQSISDIEQKINSMVDAAVASGKIINPNLTPEDIANIDPSEFFKQAESSISPYYKEKFQTIKDSLSKTLSNLGYDLGLKKESINRTADTNLRTGKEELASRGLTFSSGRTMFEKNTNDQRQRDLTAAQNDATRSAQIAASDAESKLGTAELSRMSIPSVGDYAYSPGGYFSTPLTGSLNSERQYAIESTSKELQTQDAIKRAYATRALSFG